ncbi:hypothetical protein V8E36_007326 [Tilletia maclaganii]
MSIKNDGTLDTLAAQDLSADSMMSSATNGTVLGAESGASGSKSVRNGKGVAFAAADESDGEDDDTFRPIYEGSMIDKREFIRLALQSLRDLGLESAAHALEQESGVTLEHPSITAFRSAVVSGQWKNADRLLMDGLRHAAARSQRHASSSSSCKAATSVAVSTSGSSSLAPPSTSSSGRALGSSSSSSSSVNVNCVLRDPETQSLESIKFALQQQRFLELLEAGQNKKALSVLRDRLTPLNYGSERLHQLSSLIMCESPEQLRARARWDGAKGRSRHDLLQEIEAAVLPTVMIPSRRLPQLLEQAQMLQKQMDPYYNLDSKTEHLSLYVDVQSDRSGFPSQPTFKLYEHEQEVWTLDFAPDGGKLASGGKDHCVITYSVSPTAVEKLNIYGPFSAGGVSNVRWSPDSRQILCAAEEAVYLIDTADGTHTLFREHIYRITAVAWLPDGSGFVSGAMDGRVLFWNSAGEVTRKWDISPYRVLGLDVSADGRRMVVISYRVEPLNQHQHSTTTSSSASASYSDSPSPSSTTVGHYGEDGRAGPSALLRSGGQERNRIFFYDLESFSVLGLAGTAEEMTCASISKDSRFVLINKRPNETQVWDIERQEPVQVYQGHTIFRNVIGGCFGGAEKNNFIITGSEDAKIYVYHRASGRTLERLSHGTGCVNSVAWHPTNKAMFASASDDASVCVWAPGERRRGTLSGRLGLGGSSSSTGLGNGYQRTSSGSGLGNGASGSHGGGSGGAGSGDRSGSRRKSDSAYLAGGGSGGGFSRASLGGSGGGGGGGGSGSGGAEASSSHERRGEAGGSESDSGMGGPMPFPWAVSPLRRDSNGDVSMDDEGMYEDAS